MTTQNIWMRKCWKCENDGLGIWELLNALIIYSCNKDDRWIHGFVRTDKFPRLQGQIFYDNIYINAFVILSIEIVLKPPES